MILQKLKQLKHRLKLAATKSFTKADEFDPKVYDAFQFKRPKEPYYILAEVLQKLLKPKTVIDVGCANGFTLDWWLKHNVMADGIEGAAAAFSQMPAKVKLRVKRWDLRRALLTGKRYDLVLCTEVAEHLKPEHEGTLLKNLLNLTGKYLVISWSDKWDDYKGTPKQEHFNPRSKSYVKKRITGLRLKFEAGLTDRLNLNLKNSKAFIHWKGNLLVFSK